MGLGKRVRELENQVDELQNQVNKLREDTAIQVRGSSSRYSVSIGNVVKQVLDHLDLDLEYVPLSKPYGKLKQKGKEE